MTESLVLALDIGGTKLAAGLVDGEGRVLARAVRPTPAEGADEVYGALLGAASEVLARRRPSAEACGVGSGGPMAAGGSTVSPLNIPVWRDFPLRARLLEDLGMPVYVDNDAKALALGEGWCGGAAGCRDYGALVVSTGVGGGLVVDGRLLHGRSGNAGHIGHVCVVPDGDVCGCGARGCVEAHCSGLHLQRRTGRPAAEAPVELRRATGRLVGRALASVANLLDVGLFLVAGSVALGFGDDFFGPAQDELSAGARLDFSREAVVRPAGLGAEGPLIGAAAVAFGARDWRGVVDPPDIDTRPVAA